MIKILLLGFGVFWAGPIWANSALQEQLAMETRRREQSLQPLEKALVQGENLAAQGEVLRAWEVLHRIFA